MPYTLTNNYLQYRNSFHWDKNAYVVAGCTPSGGCDYTKARIRHFTHVPPSSTIKNTSLESVKYPLENRIWYAYAGQADNLFGGTYDQPTAIGRVLDDGTTQLRQFTYDAAGFFKLTQMIDPLGRMAAQIYRTAQLRLARGHLIRPSLTQFERGPDGFEPHTYSVDTEERPPMALTGSNLTRHASRSVNMWPENFSSDRLKRKLSPSLGKNPAGPVVSDGFSSSPVMWSYQICPRKSSFKSKLPFVVFR